MPITIMKSMHYSLGISRAWHVLVWDGPYLDSQIIPSFPNVGYKWGSRYVQIVSHLCHVIPLANDWVSIKTGDHSDYRQHSVGIRSCKHEKEHLPDVASFCLYLTFALPVSRWEALPCRK